MRCEVTVFEPRPYESVAAVAGRRRSKPCHARPPFWRLEMAREAGSNEQQRGHAFAVGEREVDRELTAERASHQHGPAAAFAVDHGAQLRDVIGGDVAGLRAAATPVVTHHVPEPRERGHVGIEHPRVKSARVQQHDSRRPAALAIVDESVVHG